jgi:hypothetical protein
VAVIGIDTRVLVRFLTRDEETQYEQARSLIQTQLDAVTPHKNGGPRAAVSCCFRTAGDQ